MKNYYQILGLEEGATLDEIKAAYRKYAAKFHPDKHGDDEFFKERFQEIQEAYEYLLNHYGEKTENEDRYILTSDNIVLFECNSQLVQVGDIIIIKWQINHECKCVLEIDNGYSMWTDSNLYTYGEKRIKIKRIEKKIKIIIRIYNNYSEASKIITIDKKRDDIQYFILRNGKQEGAFKIEELWTKEINPSTLVWHKGLKDWVRAEELPELRCILNRTSFTSNKVNSPFSDRSQFLTYTVGLFLLFILLSISAFVYMRKEESGISETIQQKEDIQYQGIYINLENWENGHKKCQNSQLFLMSAYANEVELYGQKMSQSECMKLIQKLLNKYDTYNQTILGDYIFIPLHKELVRVEFVKRITINGKSNDYKAYLVFRKFGEENSQWRIVKESDTQTDAYFERLRNR